MIHANFLHDNAKAMLQIQLPRRMNEDEIIWGLDRRGVFTVKSTYFFALCLSKLSDPSSFNGISSNHIWKSIWKALAPPKAKICCWKILHDLIPTRENLNKKGIHMIIGVCFAGSTWNLLSI